MSFYVVSRLSATFVAFRNRVHQMSYTSYFCRDVHIDGQQLDIYSLYENGTNISLSNSLPLGISKVPKLYDAYNWGAQFLYVVSLRYNISIVHMTRLGKLFSVHTT